MYFLLDDIVKNFVLKNEESDFWAEFMRYAEYKMPFFPVAVKKGWFDYKRREHLFSIRIDKERPKEERSPSPLVKKKEVEAGDKTETTVQGGDSTKGTIFKSVTNLFSRRTEPQAEPPKKKPEVASKPTSVIHKGYQLFTSIPMLWKESDKKGASNSHVMKVSVDEKSEEDEEEEDKQEGEDDRYGTPNETIGHLMEEPGLTAADFLDSQTQLVMEGLLQGRTIVLPSLKEVGVFSLICSNLLERNHSLAQRFDCANINVERNDPKIPPTLSESEGQAMRKLLSERLTQSVSITFNEKIGMDWSFELLLSCPSVKHVEITAIPNKRSSELEPFQVIETISKFIAQHKTIESLTVRLSSYWAEHLVTIVKEIRTQRNTLHLSLIHI
eukprot:TRINITY_DN24617_c0_g2_i1.p1 TRINITY_DN24617_c0_g2~~TRINITY_DN24617_c0_g2_i1.p1  ORF type:complete len:385 (-),score=46.81 TRINITY_DN24617_c0_g2_i1:60-1214(-)